MPASLTAAVLPNMSKIRINELARELEVKPSVIIDLLPELGVTDKKTHSSSLDDDIALQLRQRVAGAAPGSFNGHEAPEYEAPREVAPPYFAPAQPAHTVPLEP